MYRCLGNHPLPVRHAAAVVSDVLLAFVQPDGAKTEWNHIDVDHNVRPVSRLEYLYGDSGNCDPHVLDEESGSRKLGSRPEASRARCRRTGSPQSGTGPVGSGGCDRDVIGSGWTPARAAPSTRRRFLPQMTVRSHLERLREDLRQPQ